MLYISYDKLLARMLGVSRSSLRRTLARCDDFYEMLRLYDPAKPDKPRDVVNATGKLRHLQSMMHREVLLRKLPISPYSHGGVRDRHIKSNAEVHSGSEFVFKADISNFYPSIRQSRVFRLFRDDFHCSEPVAALCTRLCTFDHHLSLGLTTSPILADQLLRTVDKRIGCLCDDAKLKYSRFVDDITISGKYDIEESGIPRAIEKIILQNAFQVNHDKHEFGRISGGLAITGIRRNRRGNLDVQTDYYEEVMHQLVDVERLASGDEFDRSRPYYTRAQVRGRIQFIMWVNASRGKRLIRRYRRIRWTSVEDHARRQGLFICKKQVVKRGNKPELIRA